MSRHTHSERVWPSSPSAPRPGGNVEKALRSGKPVGVDQKDLRGRRSRLALVLVLGRCRIELSLTFGCLCVFGLQGASRLCACLSCIRRRATCSETSSSLAPYVQLDALLAHFGQSSLLARARHALGWRGCVRFTGWVCMSGEPSALARRMILVGNVGVSQSSGSRLRRAHTFGSRAQARDGPLLESLILLPSSRICCVLDSS